MPDLNDPLNREIERRRSREDWTGLIRLSMIFGVKNNIALKEAMRIVDGKSFSELGQSYWLREQLERFHKAPTDPMNQIDEHIGSEWTADEIATLAIMRNYPLVENCQQAALLQEIDQDEAYAVASDATCASIEMAEGIGDWALAAYLLGMLGYSYMFQNWPERALPIFQRAQKHFERSASGDEELYLHFVAKTNANISDAFVGTGNASDATPVCLKAIEQFERVLPDRPELALDLALSYYQLADLRYREQDFLGASEACARSLAIAEAGGGRDEIRLASILNNCGVVLLKLGEIDAAMRAYGKAHLICEDNDGPAVLPNKANTLLNIGNVYLCSSRYEHALACLEEALEITGELALIRPHIHLRSLAGILVSLSATLSKLNRHAEAVECSSRALDAFASLTANGGRVQPSEIAAAYQSMGNRLQEDKQFASASKAFDEAVSALRVTTDVASLGHDALATCLACKAACLLEIGTPESLDEADRTFAESLEMYRELLEANPASRTEFASTLRGYSDLWQAKGREAESLAYLVQAAEEYRRIDEFTDNLLSVRSQMGTYFSLAQKLHSQYQLNDDSKTLASAYMWCKLAREVGEQFRLFFGNEEMRLNVQCVLWMIYELAFEICIERHTIEDSHSFLDEAFENAEVNRARNLVEMLAAEEVAPANAPAELVTKFRILHQKYVHASRLLTRAELLSNSSSSSDLGNGSSDAAANAAKYQKAMLSQQLELAKTEYEACLSEIRRVHDTDFDPDQVVATISVKELQRTLLDNETVAIQFSLAASQGVVIVASNEGLRFLRLPQLTDAFVDQQTASWRACNFESLENNIQTALHKIGDAIFPELLASIPDGIQRLIVCPHHSLHLIPFHALPVENGQVLGDLFEVVIAPNYSVLNRCNRRPLASGGQKTVIKGDCTQLAFAEAEVQAVFDQRNVQVLQSRDEIRESQAEVGLLHFVGHAEFRTDEPLSSRLRLKESQNSVTLRDILVNFQMPKLNLAVLSGCLSGVQLPNNLDEYQSFPTAFLYAGAHAAVGSLWPTSDLATLILMQRFYQNLYGGLSVAGALHMAQNWLRGAPDHLGEALEDKDDVREHILSANLFGFVDDEDDRRGNMRVVEWGLEYLPDSRPFGSPFIWAPFFVMGNPSFSLPIDRTETDILG